MKIFSGSANTPLAQDIAHAMGRELSPIEVFIFSDGERRIRILEHVVDQDTVIIQPTTTPVDSNYMELFFMADALSRSGARSITAVIPYVGYQRQDHIFRDGEAVSLDVIARTLEAVGIDRIVTCDLHSIRIPQAFSTPIAQVSALPLFADSIRQHGWNTSDTVLVSPDRGGVRRIKLLAKLLDNMAYAVVEKKRDVDTGDVETVSIEGKLSRRALIVDDMITSGSTVVKVAELLKKKEVEEVMVFATHGIFAREALKLLQESPVEKVFVTDTVMIPEERRIPKLEVLSVVELIAEELKKI